MNTETEALNAAAVKAVEAEMPSAEWVKAVSDLLDTDPADLLAEMGYYDRSEEQPKVAAANEASSN